MTEELKQAAQAALEQLEFLNACYTHKTAADAIAALQSALTQRPAAQAERIAELEAEVLEQARCNGMGAERELALMAERDTLREEVERLSEFFDADMAVSKIFDEVSPGLTSPPGTEWSDRADAAVARRCAAVIAIDHARTHKETK